MSLLTDTEIEAAIESNDDPDHPDAYTADEVRSLLNAINTDVLQHWDLYEDPIDDGSYEVVHENSNVIVLADHTGQLWNDQFETMEVGDEDGILQSIIKSLHHTAARTECDYSWSTADPLVVEKTSDVRAGEQHVLREIARRTDEYGSVARAVDTLATETHGWSKTNWARLTGRNPSTVTRTTDN